MNYILEYNKFLKNIAYHYTSHSGIIDILKSNKLMSINSSGISLTRNINFHTEDDGFVSINYRLCLDLNKIKHNYKVVPKQDTDIITDKNGSSMRNCWKGDVNRDLCTVEAEELIYTNELKDLRKYIISVGYSPYIDINSDNFLKLKDICAKLNIELLKY